MKIYRSLCFLITCATIYFGTCIVTHAQMYYLYSYGFVCYNHGLQIGDSGGWVNYDNKSHYIRSDLPQSDPEYFEVFLRSNSPSFFHTYHHSGTYTFHDDLSSYTGYFTVVPNPIVTITNPPNGAIFTSPVSFDLQAVTTITPGSVLFYVDDVLIGKVTAPPYTVQVASLAVGNRVLKAIATNRGYEVPVSTNSVSITVVPPITVQHPRLVAGQFVFDAQVVAGWQTVLQTSSNLSTWAAIQTNTALSTLQTFTNAPTTGLNFYRVAQGP